MGYKNVCLPCRKAFNMGTDHALIRAKNCPECGNPMCLINHKFRPPKRSDIKQWKVVDFLLRHGFVYQHIQDRIEVIDRKTYSYYASYPTTMKEAEEFVETYKDQAIKPK